MAKTMESIIGIANQKGGVGKTTTAINLASCLGAAEKRTLLVDLDPQGNSTSGIGVDRAACKHSVYDILVGTLPVQEAVLAAVGDGVDVLPSTQDLVGAEVELVRLTEREMRLRQALQAVGTT